MTQKNLEYIPFYLSYAHGVELFIIDNRVLQFHDDWYGYDQYVDIFLLLCQLEGNEITRKFIPNRFLKHLESKDNKFLRKKITHQIGWGESPGTDYTLTVEILKREDYPVMISDFDKTDFQGRRRAFKSNKTAKLSARDAFISFSNLVVGASFNFIVEFFQNKMAQKEAKMKLFKILETPTDLDKSVVDPKSDKMHVSYSYDYLHYTLMKIQRNEITPEEILKLSGVYVLALLSEIEPVKSFINNCYRQLIDNLEELNGNEILSFYSLILITQHGYGIEYADSEETKEYLEEKAHLVKQIRLKLIELQVCDRNNTSWHNPYRTDSPLEKY